MLEYLILDTIYCTAAILGFSIGLSTWMGYLLAPPEEYTDKKRRHLLLVAVISSVLAAVGLVGLVHSQQTQNNTNTPAPTPIYLTLPNPITQPTPPNSQTNPQ